MSSVPITISVPPAQLAEAARVLNPKQLHDAIRRSVNRTATATQSRVSFHVRQELALKDRDVTQRIKIKRANYRDLSATVTVSRKSVPLGLYGAKQSKKGVRVKIRKGKPTEVLKSTFLFDHGRAGFGKGVFERKRVGGGKRVPRLPIQHRMGPTVVGVLAGKPGMLESVHKDVSGRFEKAFLSQIDFILNRRKVDR